MDRTTGGAPGAEPVGRLRGQFYQNPPPRVRLPPSRFVRALLHHYGVELQCLSPNAISNAVTFTMVCEGYLGVMPH